MAANSKGKKELLLNYLCLWAGIPHEDPVGREAAGTEGMRHAEKLDSSLPCTSRLGPPSFLAEGKTDTFLAPAFLGSLGLTFSQALKALLSQV